MNKKDMLWLFLADRGVDVCAAILTVGILWWAL